MEFNFVKAGTPDFDSQTYVCILLAIAKADKENGPPEYAFIRRQAQRLGVDYDHFYKNTDKNFLIKKQKVSRLTALVILKDAIALASLDGNFTLPEKQRVYGFAEKLDISRNDVDELINLVSEYHRHIDKWRKFLRSR
jgi:tellurite resistance protein